MSSASAPGVNSFPPSDMDGQTLSEFGLIIMLNVIGVIWESVFLSAYTIFFAVAVYSIVRRGLKSRSSIIMLLVVIYLYAISVTLWALNVTDLFKVIHSLLVDYPTMPLEDRPTQSDLNVISMGTPMEALFMFNMVVGDSVVIWRVWVIYQRTLRAVFVPCVLLLMSFVFTIIDITCLTRAGPLNQSSISGGGGVCTHAELVSWAFSLGTNACCTLLICLKAWQHRRSMRSLGIPQTGHQMSTNKILSLLTESGFIYCLFWITQLVLFFPVFQSSIAGAYVYEMFSSMGDQVSGMYPTLIIVIVNLQHTIWDSDGSQDASNIKALATGPGKTDVSTVRWAPVSSENMVGSSDERATAMQDISEASSTHDV